MPEVRDARKAMCKQMTAMFLNQWRLHAHICENFNPHKNGTEVAGKVWPDDCTGCKFYHWGVRTQAIYRTGNITGLLRWRVNQAPACIYRQ